MDRRIDTAEAAGALFAPLAEQPREVVAFAYLNAERRLLGMRHAPSCWTGAAEVPIRAVAGDALAFGAAGVVMAHNHPSGDPTPSAADRAVTRRLARVLDGLEVRLVDHLVVARGGVTSFCALGLL